MSHKGYLQVDLQQKAFAAYAWKLLNDNDVPIDEHALNTEYTLKRYREQEARATSNRRFSFKMRKQACEFMIFAKFKEQQRKADLEVMHQIMKYNNYRSRAFLQRDHSCCFD